MLYGLRSGLAAMAAAVVGGVGNPGGALLGGVTLGILSSFSDFLLDAHWTPVLVLAALVAFLTFRPTGLLGSTPLNSSEAVSEAPAPTTAPAAKPLRTSSVAFGTEACRVRPTVPRKASARSKP